MYHNPAYSNSLFTNRLCKVKQTLCYCVRPAWKLIRYTDTHAAWLETGKNLKREHDREHEPEHERKHEHEREHEREPNATINNHHHHHHHHHNHCENPHPILHHSHQVAATFATSNVRDLALCFCRFLLPRDHVGICMILILYHSGAATHATRNGNPARGCLCAELAPLTNKENGKSKAN